MSGSRGTAPPELYAIGPQGSGKTTISLQIAKKFGAIYFDGDDAIPKNSWMKWQVESGLPVFPWQVKNFMKKHFFPALEAKRKEAAAQNKPLIVSQGLFFNRDRLLIHDSSRGTVYFLVISVTPELQKLQIAARCKAQNKGRFTARLEQFFAVKSNPHFEVPDARLRAFKINYAGKGSEEKLMTQFTSLACFEDFSRYQPSDDKTALTTSAILVSLPPRPEEKSPAAPSRKWVNTAAVVTIAVVCGAMLLARRLQNKAPEVAEVIRSTPKAL